MTDKHEDHDRRLERREEKDVKHEEAKQQHVLTEQEVSNATDAAAAKLLSALRAAKLPVINVVPMAGGELGVTFGVNGQVVGTVLTPDNQTTEQAAQYLRSAGYLYASMAVDDAGANRANA